MIYFSEQYDEMKSIVEAVFARMPGSVCKRDALLKWCVERLTNYVSDFLCLLKMKDSI
jgi:hypothetical protein